jgi:RNA polymerase sigma factor (sigma-70 family)
MPDNHSPRRPAPARSELAVARAAAAREEDAVREIVGRVASRLRSIAWHMCFDHHETEDLCQEALAKVTLPSVLEAFRAEGPLDAYLANVGVRAMISRQRTKGVWRGRVDPVADPPDPGDAGPSPERLVDDRSFSGPLRRALQSLPERARLTVLLISVGDLTYEQTAAVLGLKVGTVKSTYHRARVELQRQLASHATANHDVAPS